MSDPADKTRFWGRVHERIATAVGRPRYWLLFSLMLGSYPLIHIATHPLPDPIPIYDKVEPFELVDHRGEKIGIWRGRSPREEALEACEVISEKFPEDRRAPDQICESPTRPDELREACDACITARDRGRLFVNLHQKIWVATVHDPFGSRVPVRTRPSSASAHRAPAPVPSRTQQNQLPASQVQPWCAMRDTMSYGSGSGLLHPLRSLP